MPTWIDRRKNRGTNKERVGANGFFYIGWDQQAEQVVIVIGVPET